MELQVVGYKVGMFDLNNKLFQAYKAGLYGPKVVWVFISWFTPNFYLHDLNTTDCTAEQMRQAAEGAMFTGYHYLLDDLDLPIGQTKITGDSF